MRDESRVIANALLSYGARGVAGVVGILMVPYLIGQLGAERYGTIGLAGSILALVLLIELGIRPAASRQFTHFLWGGEPTRANELASSAMAVYAGLAVAVILLMAAASTTLLGTLRVAPALLPETRAVLLLIAAGLGVALLQAPYEAALASQLRYDVMQYCTAGGSIFRAAFIVALFSLLEPSLIVWAAAALVWAVLSLLIHRRQASASCPSLAIERTLVTRRGLRDLAGFGIWASVMHLAQWLTEYSGPLIISAWLGTEAVARYTPAIVLVVALQPLSRAFLGQLIPVVTRAHSDGEPERVRRVLVRSTRYSLLIGAGPLVGIATVAPALMTVWLGEGFEITAWVLVAWCLRGLLIAGAGASFAVFLGTGRLRAIAVTNVVLAIAGVATAVYLVGFTALGVLGPAIAMLGAQLVRSGVWFAHATRITRQPRAAYLREAFRGPLLCLGALAAAALLVQEALELQPLAELALAGTAAAVVYVPLVWSLGLDAEDRGKAHGYLRSAWQQTRSLLRSA